MPRSKFVDSLSVRVTRVASWRAEYARRGGAFLNDALARRECSSPRSARRHPLRVTAARRAEGLRDADSAACRRIVPRSHQTEKLHDARIVWNSVSTARANLVRMPLVPERTAEVQPAYGVAALRRAGHASRSAARPATSISTRKVEERGCWQSDAPRPQDMRRLISCREAFWSMSAVTRTADRSPSRRHGRGPHSPTGRLRAAASCEF